MLLEMAADGHANLTQLDVGTPTTAAMATAGWSCSSPPPPSSSSPVPPGPEEEVRGHVSSRLRSAKSPTRIAFVESLPFSEAGKLLRRVPRESLARSGSPAECQTLRRYLPPTS